MDGEGQTPDDLKIDLDWPDDGRDEVRHRPVRLNADLARTGSASLPLGPPTSSYTRDTGTEASTAGASAPAMTGGDRAEPQATPAAIAPSFEKRSLESEDGQFASRLARIAEESAATRSRMDTLTDAVITMRSFLNDRVGEVGEAVSRTEAQLVRELSSAVERLPRSTESDLELLLEQSRAELAVQLREAVSTTQSQLEEDLDRALTRWAPRSSEAEDQLLGAIESSVSRAFVKLNSQMAHHLDEVLVECRAQTVDEVTQVLTGAQDLLLNRLETMAAASQRRATDQAADFRQRIEQASNAIADLADQAEATDMSVARIGEALSAELASVAESLTAGMDRSSAELRLQAKAGSERAVADVGRLADSVAAALVQVADRLERLAASNDEQVDVVDAIADALDGMAERVEELGDRGRSRHDRLMNAITDLKKTSAHNETRDSGVTTESVATIEAAIDSLAASVERQFAELRTRPRGETSVQKLLASLDQRVGIIASQQEVNSSKAQKSSETVAETVERLAVAQAEDLERILDAVEAQPDPQIGRSDGSQDILHQLQQLGSQLDALRRRIAVRARSPELTDQAIDDLAERIALRLAAAPRG